MPRRLRISTGGIVYHVLNRRTGRLPLFRTKADFVAFERTLSEAIEWTAIRIAAYTLMPNHWHLLVWPRSDRELSEVMHWLTLTHTQRWHAFHGTSGTGPLYQGRFKSFPVQTDEHFLTVARYVERNARRAKLVRVAEDWRWSSLWQRQSHDATVPLCEWPVPRPRNWVRYVNQAETPHDLEGLRRSVKRGCPFGTERWQVRTAKQLGLESTLRPRGRPKRV